MSEKPKPRKQDAATPTTEELQRWQGEPKPTTESSDQLANQRGPIGMKDGKPYALSMPVLCDVQPVQSLTTTGEWTADDDGVLLPMHRFVGQYAKEIADTHNAALAAERELGQQECNRLDAFWQNEVAKQLAAERKIWDNRIAKAIKIITAERKECSLLSIQLMDCYGKLAEVQQALAEERGS